MKNKNTASFSQNNFDAIGVGIMRCTSDGKVLETNRVARQLLAFAPKKLEHLRHFFSDATPIDQNVFTSVENILAQLLSSRIPHSFFPFEFEYHHKCITYLVSANKSGVDGSGSEVFVTFYDISELQRHKSAQELFVRSFAHELKQPLSLMKAFAYYLQRAEDAKTITKYVEKSNEQITIMTQMIEDIVDANKFTLNTFSLEKADIDIVALIKKSIANFRAMYPSRSVTLKFDASMHTDKIIVHADEDRMLQVFGNILSNAEKYSEVQDKIAILLALEDDSIRIDCLDTGIGIDPKYHKSIFEPYMRTNRAERKRSGLGLGLALVKNIVVRHEGSITVENNRPKGSVFRIILPIVQ